MEGKIGRGPSNRAIFTVNPKLTGQGRDRGASTLPHMDEFVKIGSSETGGKKIGTVPGSDVFPVESNFTVPSIAGVPNPDKVAHFVDSYTNLGEATQQVGHGVTPGSQKGI